MAKPAATESGLQPYPTYKPSGVDWLGEVPVHWETKRLKWVSRLQRGYDLPADRWVPGSFPVVSSGGIIGSHSESKCTGPGVVLGRCGSTNAVFFVERDFWPHNTSLFVTNFYGNNPKWCYYLLNTISKEDHAGKSAVPAVDRKDLFQIIIAVPPLVEQATVARYIDYVDRLIRRCIQTKEKLVELLEEQRQTLVNEAVTGRVDVRTGQPYPAYKPSGVEWLGEVPEHWEVRRLKTVCSMQSGDGITAKSIESSGVYPVYGGHGHRGYTSRYTHDGTYVLIGRQGALCGNVHVASGRFWASEHALVTTPNLGHSPEWLGAILEAMNLNQYSIAAAQPGLSLERVLELRMPVPGAPEQAAIARYLDHTDQRVQCRIRSVKQQIVLLEEYRTRLIADLVTGKLDVREAATRLPNGVDETFAATKPDAPAKIDPNTTQCLGASTWTPEK